LMMAFLADHSPILTLSQMNGRCGHVFVKKLDW